MSQEVTDKLNNEVKKTVQGLQRKLYRAFSHAEVSYEIKEGTINILIGDKNWGGVTLNTLEITLTYLRNHAIFPFWIGIANEKLLKLEAIRRKEYE
jgi:hypothetical protein